MNPQYRNGNRDQDEYAEGTNNMNQYAGSGGQNPNDRNQQVLYSHARENLKNRLFEMGVQQKNMPASIQKPIFKPSTIIPKRVMEGYEFYASRLEESMGIQRPKGSNKINMNNVTNLVNLSFNNETNKKFTLPELNNKTQIRSSTQQRKSRSLVRQTGQQDPDRSYQGGDVLNKSLLNQTAGGNEANVSKIDSSFGGGVSPIRQHDKSFTTSFKKPHPPTSNKMGMTGGVGATGYGEELLGASFGGDRLNLTYDEGTSKKIINKLTGRNIPPTRIPYQPKYFRSNSMRSRGYSMASEDEEANKPPPSLQQNQDFGKINQLHDIDSFIYLIKEAKINQNEFIYLVRQDGDHYNLKVTDYTKIKSSVFWTLSAKGVTKYDNHSPVEFIPLKDWLRERDQYNHIKKLKFFMQFRSWKTLKKWVKILRRNQRKTIEAQLNEKLFMANKMFQEIILQHKKLCLEIEQLKFIEFAASMQQLESTSLEDFKRAQEDKRALVVKQLQDQSDLLHDNARAGIRKILEKLRDHILDEIANDEDKGQDELRDPTQDTKNDSKSVFEALGFPEFMNYGHRSMLRRECSRFLRLAYLLDFMSVEAVGNMYVSSALEMVNKFGDLMKQYDFDCRENRYLKRQHIEPLFLVNVGVDVDAPAPQYRTVELGTEIQDVHDFDLMEYAQFEKEIVIEEEDEDKGATSPAKKAKKKKEEEEKRKKLEEEMTHERVLTKRQVSNLHQKWFFQEPSIETFKRELDNFFETSIESIQMIERWSKHPDFAPYANALEEWDEIIGEKWIMPENKYLSILWYLKDNKDYNRFRPEMHRMLETSFKRVDSMLSDLDDKLDFYWRDANTDFSILANDRLKDQTYIFTSLLRLYNLQADEFSEQIIPGCDLGLFKLNLGKARDIVVPKPKATLTYLEEFLPEIMRKRVHKMRDWLQVSIRKLSGMVAGIEDFIEQKNNFNIISIEYEDKKPLIELLYEFFALITDNNINLPNDDKDQFNKLSIYTADLSNALQNVELATNKNTDRFIKTLQERVVKLQNETVAAQEEIVQEKFLNPTEKIQELIAELEFIEKGVIKLEETSEKYRYFEEVLQVQEYADFRSIDDLRNDLNLRMTLWKSKEEWERLSEEWMNLPFQNIDAKVLEEKANLYAKNVNRCDKNLPDSQVIKDLKRVVYDFRDTMPIVTALRSEYLKTDHWDEIKNNILKQDFDINDDEFTLSKLISMNVAEHQEELLNVATTATQEHMLEQQINEVEQFWKERKIAAENYKGKKDSFILVEIEDLTTDLDEFLSTMSNILANRYVKNLRSKAEKVQGDLLLFADIIDKWVECQKKWMYLENIFQGPDIRKKLPNEDSLFQSCDKSIKGLFNRFNVQPFAFRAIKIPNIVNILNTCLENLDTVEHNLKQYLDVKRRDFPRFYFISDDELIEILSNAANIDAIQKHLRKCFEGINRLDIPDPKVKVIAGLVSGEGENVQLNKQSMRAQGEVELWLNSLQNCMIEVIQNLFRTGREDFFNDPLCKKDRNHWVKTHIGQVVSVVSHIQWCEQTEIAIEAMGSDDPDPDALYNCYQSNLKALAELTALVTKNITDIQRKIVVALITQDVHGRDIVDKLQRENVESKNNFLWQQQLRYYWEEDKEKKTSGCIVRQVNAVINYGYEYLGATTRLVITPLTDRCWITITGALNLQLGASPAGPAGTGKTESTKDLAKGLGQFCVVFNCSDQITTAMMSKLFSGLAQQGAWTCLDEFNRIDIEVLSVIAQQLLTVRLALLKRATDFIFEGSKIPLKKTFGCFITMNPGYAGRTELPDNLKLLFRPVAMMIPDYGLIAEIMLFAEGFENAKGLSKKMVQLYKLSSEQLSQQDHYDFGMRAVKSVLVMAGALKRQETHLSEDVVLIRAMRDSNVPKFLKDDLPLFSALIQDLFPEAEIPEKDYGVLQGQIIESISTLGLQRHKDFELKVVQLFETFNVRFGVMIVGPSGSGKTKCYRALQNAMTSLREKKIDDRKFQRVEIDVLNPKSITMGELYGEVNVFTQEWVDGLASSIIRTANEINENDPNQKNWVVFDGPVDALWIENMNTVLDDNMTLCLANGERIKLRNQLNMLFEVQDLAVASPATVSRCGMVYMNHDCLGWMPYVESWMKMKYPDDKIIPKKRYFDFLINKFENNMDGVLEKLEAFQKEPIPTPPIQMAASVCSYIEALLQNKDVFKQSEDVDETERRLTYIFAFAFIWGVGGSLSEDCHARFDNLIKDTFKSIVFPKNDICFEFFVDPDNNFSFSSWDVLVEEFLYVKDTPYFQLLVPTTDTTKYSNILDLLITIQKPVFFTGVTGVGKSVITQNLLFTLKETKSIVPMMLSFSAQTNSRETQMTIEGKLNKKKSNVFGARPGEKIAIFIDDINMPLPEVYGAQPPIELLRQYVDFGGLYDRHKLFWKKIEDTSIVAVAAPPGGGRNKITQRFTRHFNIVYGAKQSDKILMIIFGKILEGFLDAWKFPEAVKKTVEGVIRATVELYTKISEELLPTPAKFHYTFNLRDISKVFQGILQVKPQSCSQTDDMLRLWVHECSRVFGDRLINNTDREWFGKSVTELLGRVFSVNWEYEALFVQHTITFGDLLKLEAPTKLYEEIKDRDKLLKVLDDKQEEHNMTNQKKFNLVFFEDAVNHIVRISRILRQPRGNAMLIGVGGSGKQSLAGLSSYILGCEIFQIELVKNYNKDSFKEDLKKLMKKAGIERKAVTFIITDSQIADEIFLEYINNMLNSGEVPNLFKKEDLDEIFKEVGPYNKSLKRVDSPDVVYSTFIQTVQDNLHIVLCMSPVGENLRVWCRKFPSLVNCCTLDWFSAWPEDALTSVAYSLLSEVEFPTKEIRENLAAMACQINLSVATLSKNFYDVLKRRVYNTPKSYLDSINLYISILDKKRNEFHKMIRKLSGGIDKLKSTNEIVAQLQKDLVKLQPELEKQTANTEIFLKQLAENTEVANEKEKVVQKEVEKVNVQAMEIKKVADEAEAELNKAMPALLEAENALKGLSKSEVTEIKSFTNPPDAVRFVMEAVCLLLGEKQDWASAKQVLMGLDFLERLNTFDRNNVSEQKLRKLATYVSKPDFEPNVVAQKNLACKSICLWCRAIDNYCRVNKEVAPKKKKMAEMSEKLDVANKELAGKQGELDEVRNNLAKLQKECDETLEKKEQLIKDMELTEKRVENAHKLTALLGDEGVRWKDQVEKLNIEVDKLIGDVFVSASLISYLGPFTGAYRAECVSQWLEQMREKEIPMGDEYSLANVCGDPIKIRDWVAAGLPSDTVSVDNGIITEFCSRWPLCIDPQIQANKWIKNTEKPNGLIVMKFSDHNLLKKFQNAISSGYPVLIEDVEERMEPSIDTILTKSISNVDGRRIIRVGDQNVDFHNQFKLYLTTKMPNPHYLPEVCIRVTLINFTVTFEGLQDQLLGDVVKQEAPAVEKQRDEVVVKVSELKKSLRDLQEKILELLAASQGLIVDDYNLIETLESSKEKSAEVQKNLEESQEIEIKINETRSAYIPVAVRGSILYFVVSDLAGIDPMYQNSLMYFKKLFNTSIEQSEKSKELSVRLDTLIKNITKNVYVNVCRGLFEAHKRIFSFLIATSIERKAKNIEEAEWNIFLRGVPQSERDKLTTPNPDVKIFSDFSWEIVQMLGIKFKGFEDIHIDMAQNLSKWESFLFAEEIYQEPVPSYPELNAFRKLMLIRAVRGEQLVFSMSQYVAEKLGKFYEDAATASMADVFTDSDKKTPIIFILSQGADPSDQIIKFAKDQGQGETFNPLSLGQGQGVKAEKLIEHGQKDGIWVMLQNCHLSKSWMPELEKIVEKMSTAGDPGDEDTEIHPNFRLLLTSMPASYFPVSVLQNGLKLTTEPPRGLKANLKKTYAEFSQEFLDDCEKPEMFKKMLFGLSFFHAIIQERRKFGPLGFNIRYEFNTSDLDVSTQTLRMFLNEQNDEFPWDALLYVTGQINYGGRVTDDQDRTCLMNILKKYYTPELFQEDYWFSDSGTYFAPKDGLLQHYKDYIDSLPQNENPEVFGMHDNANITFLNQETNKTIEAILIIQPRMSDASQEKSTDEMVTDIATQLLNDLPGNLIKEAGNKKLFEINNQGLMTSLAIVLLQEMEKFNKLLNLVRYSLDQLKKAIGGFVVMSQDLDQMYGAFLNNQLPQNWKKVSYPSLKPLGSWYQDLIERVKFMENWLMNDYPVSYWMSGFFFPQGFMTGVLQTHSRKYKTAVDKLSFKFKILNPNKDLMSSPPVDGVYIYGLYVDGGRWDESHNTIADQFPGELFSKMPAIHFIPAEGYVTSEDDYRCPVYKTSVRAGVLSTTGQSTNFILHVDIPSKNERPEFWTLRGTALLCQLDT